MMAIEEFIELVIGRIDSANIPYMITGSYAMNTYSIPKTTRDLDLIVELRIGDMQTIHDLFQNDFYLEMSAIQDAFSGVGMFNAIHHNSMFKVDFILRKETPFEKIKFEKRTKKKFIEKEFNVISAEDLILSKLEWIQVLHSEKQMEDIKLLLKTPGLDLDYINKWIKNLQLKTLGIEIK